KQKMEIPTKAILRRLSRNTLQLADAIELFSSSLFLNLGIKIDKTSLTKIEEIIKGIIYSHIIKYSYRIFYYYIIIFNFFQ
ncbi:MAG: hypothetical protein IJY70_02090, partial [Clostridia bacterium]|nr:hypothetical protein [Clostridia bacterium]